MIDEVLCCYMKSPATYTREDVVEIHCHGGMMSAGQVLEQVLRSGARLARPGEFTRRAFMAGRIDLSQAEAVMELIAARGESDAFLAAEQLSGGLRARVEAMTSPLVDILAHVETALDFPDEEAEIYEGEEAARIIETEVLARIDKLLKAYESGRVFREGLKIAIVGRPNVGKSSLLNALLRKDRSIVTPLPGTTRDLIEADAILRGIPVTLVDTAGLESEPLDEAEAEGQRRAAEGLKQADLVIMVIDRSRILSDQDRRIKLAAPPGRTLGVLNKVDLPASFGLDEAREIFEGIDLWEVSAKTGQGLEELEAGLFRMVTKGGAAHGRVSGVVPNLRHKMALEEARPALVRAAQGFRSGLAPELAAFEIRSALDSLGEIVGATTPDDVLDRIFESFCLGK